MTISLINNLENLGETLVKECAQIAGMDKRSSFTNVIDDISSFQEQLQEIGEEIGMEGSLDLTLARDIKDIIKDLKEAMPVAQEEDKTVDSEEIINPATMFEQLLALNDSTTIIPTVETENVLSHESETIDLASEVVSEDIMSEENIAVKQTNSSVHFEQSEEVHNVLDEEILDDLNIESIKAETDADASSQNGFMQDETMQEHGIKAMITTSAETFEIKPAEQSVQHESSKPTLITPEKIVEQITKQTETLVKGSKVNIILNPESLGKVNIQLINTKEGLSAEFTVTTNEARELLLKGLDGLKETLTAQGIGVDNVSVKISDSKESEYNPDWTEQDDSHSGNKEHGEQKREKEKGLFEKMMAQVTDEENGNV